MVIRFLFVCLFCVAIHAGHSKWEWKGRTIYQLLTDRFAKNGGNKDPCHNWYSYCGGTYRGILDNLDYILDMGFDAIWISPVVDNVEGAYHGYHAKDWTKLNYHFGSENDLRELIETCHNRGVWVMVDVVANHVGPVGTDFGQIYPFNRPEHYHNWCDIRDEDWHNDQWRVENCRLAGLPDLNTENEWVQNELYKWINTLVRNYNFDGIRVDTTPLVPKWFWDKYRESAGVYSVGEVLDDRLDYLRGYIGHLDSVLNYGIFFTLRDVFHGVKTFYDLTNLINVLNQVFGDEQDFMGLFGDNHDKPRFLHGFANWDNLFGMLVFTLFYRGIPIIYYGDEQGYGGGDDPANREPLWTNMNRNTWIYQQLRKAITVRKQFQVWNQPYRDVWHKEHMLAFTRGMVMVVVTNRNIQVEEDMFGLPFPDGTKLCDALSDYSICIEIWGGKTHLSIEGNKTRIFVRR